MRTRRGPRKVLKSRARGFRRAVEGALGHGAEHQPFDESLRESRVGGSARLLVSNN